jgi:hypothetical protein
MKPANGKRGAARALEARHAGFACLGLIFATCAALSAAGCDNSASVNPPPPTSGGVGAVSIQSASAPQGATAATLSGTAFFSPTGYACQCSGKECLECLGTCDTGVSVTASNLNTGQAGSVIQNATPCSADWNATVPVKLGTDKIQVVAVDNFNSGNWAVATTTLNVVAASQGGQGHTGTDRPVALISAAAPDERAELALRRLSEAVLIVHAAYVAFVVLAFPLMAAGALLHWTWVRRPPFRFTHGAAVLALTFFPLAGWPCPLTWAETALWHRIGPGSAVGRFLYEGLHLQLPAAAFSLPVYLALCAAVAAFWIAVPPRFNLKAPLGRIP